jgi:antitoxin (DNA-binding transcriptional repressor) of toxin-antitoxin stability system
MKTVNIREAKTRLSSWSRPPREGRAVHCRQGGKAVGQGRSHRRAGCARQLDLMRGAFTIPDDFDTMDQKEIEKLFYGGE